MSKAIDGYLRAYQRHRKNGKRESGSAMKRETPIQRRRVSFDVSRGKYVFEARARLEKSTIIG